MKIDEDNAEALEKLEEDIGYYFSSKELLRQALTHISYRYEHSLPEGTDNENFEFLGDSIIGFVISHMLYQRLPNVDVGNLAKMKSYLVSAKILHSLAEKLNLGKYLYLSKGEEKTRGRKKKSLLANSYEALIAAIYLDGGLSATEEFIASQFSPIIDNVTNDREEFRDHKSMLQEYLRSLKLPEPKYQVIKEEGPDHRRNYVVELLIEGRPFAQAKAKSKKEAERLVARKGLQLLKKKK